jgi:hypothetical protein
MPHHQGMTISTNAYVQVDDLDEALHVRAYVSESGLPRVQVGGGGGPFSLFLDPDDAADLGQRLMVAAASIGREVVEAVGT